MARWAFKLAPTDEVSKILMTGDVRNGLKELGNKEFDHQRAQAQPGSIIGMWTGIRKWHKRPFVKIRTMNYHSHYGRLFQDWLNSRNAKSERK